MKLENWCFNQSSTGMLNNPVRTEVSFVTNDDVDRDALLDHIKLYDRSSAEPNDRSSAEPIDLQFYLCMKRRAEEDEKIQDFYRGKSPEQIKEICDGIYDRIHVMIAVCDINRSPQVRWEYRKLSAGIEILRDYGIWWAPKEYRRETNE